MNQWAAVRMDRVAQEQGNDHFWRLHDFIFEHQRELTADNLQEMLLAQLTGQTGLDQAKFKACLLEQRTVTQIERDLALGRDIEVKGTPTLFVNGHRVDVLTGSSVPCRSGR